MDTSHNQDLQSSITQTKKSLQQVISDIVSNNFCIEKLETQVEQKIDAMYAKFMGQFSTL